MNKVAIFVIAMFIFSIPTYAEEVATTTTATSTTPATTTAQTTTEPTPSTTTTPTTTEPTPSTTTTPTTTTTTPTPAPATIAPTTTTTTTEPTTTTKEPIPAPTPVPVQPAPIEKPPETKPTCPPVQCAMFCQYGNKIVNNCPVCECNEPPANMQAPTPIAPKPEVPSGCKVIVDAATDTTKTVCESVKPMGEQCPIVSEEMKRKCDESGGVSTFVMDPRGCNLFSCKYQEATTTGFMQQVQCPQQSETQAISDKCYKMGMKTVSKKDMNGCFIVECIEKRFCPIDQEVKDAENAKAKTECLNKGGNPIQIVDQDSCNRIRCLASGEKLPEERKCMNEEQDRQHKEECIKKGWKISPGIDPNGCAIIMCSPPEDQKNKFCPTQTEVDKRTNECSKKGAKIRPGYDNNGCRVVFCDAPGEGPIQGTECKPPPKEEFERCSSKGGQLIVKSDEMGCPTYVNCVKRGNERDVEVEEVEEIPTATKLLSLAFKLEAIKIDFDKLAKDTDNIAGYYGSVGNPADKARFEKVASMFEAAKLKVDEIKEKMRAKIQAITAEDLTDFKYDLKYLKEVVIQDILYVMLSTEGADISVSQIKESKKTTAIPETVKRKTKEGVQDCGTDEWCFQDMMRVCQKTIFYLPGPSDIPGAQGPIVEITGIEDKKCVLKFDLAMGPMGKPYDMVCKIPDYVMGMRGGPEEMIQYCSGSMLSMMQQEIKSGRIGREPSSGRTGPSQPAERAPQAMPSQQAVPTQYEEKRPITYKPPSEEKYCSPAGTKCPTQPPCCSDAPCFNGKCDPTAAKKIPASAIPVETVPSPAPSTSAGGGVSR